jgi:hypothetical protein
MGTKDANLAGVVLKISTPIQLAGTIVVAIITVTQISSTLAVVSVLVLGGLAALSIISNKHQKKSEIELVRLQNKFELNAKREEREFSVNSGLMRFEILIEWITKFKNNHAQNIEVCKELDISLGELQESMNYVRRLRSNQ